jgi:hypothetical protein
MTCPHILDEKSGAEVCIICDMKNDPRGGVFL